MYIYLTE